MKNNIKTTNTKDINTNLYSSVYSGRYLATTKASGLLLVRIIPKKL